MSYARAAGAYLEGDVLSRTREGLVVLLYEHLVMNIKKARLHAEKREIELKEKAVIKSLDIITELSSSLDREKGGELASRLASLYVYFHTELMVASKSLDLRRFDKVLALVQDLAGAWRVAAERAGKAQAAGQILEGNRSSGLSGRAEGVSA